MPSHQAFDAFVWITIGVPMLARRRYMNVSHWDSLVRTHWSQKDGCHHGECGFDGEDHVGIMQHCNTIKLMQHATTSCSIQCGSSHQADASHCAHGHCATRTRRTPPYRDNKCDVCGHLRHARRAVIRVASAASVIVEHRAQRRSASNLRARAGCEAPYT